MSIRPGRERAETGQNVGFQVPISTQWPCLLHQWTGVWYTARSGEQLLSMALRMLGVRNDDPKFKVQFAVPWSPIESGRKLMIVAACVRHQKRPANSTRQHGNGEHLHTDSILAISPLGNETRPSKRQRESPPARSVRHFPPFF